MTGKGREEEATLHTALWHSSAKDDAGRAPVINQNILRPVCQRIQETVVCYSNVLMPRTPGLVTNLEGMKVLNNVEEKYSGTDVLRKTLQMFGGILLLNQSLPEMFHMEDSSFWFHQVHTCSQLTHLHSNCCQFSILSLQADAFIEVSRPSLITIFLHEVEGGSQMEDEESGESQTSTLMPRGRVHTCQKYEQKKSHHCLSE